MAKLWIFLISVTFAHASEDLKNPLLNNSGWTKTYTFDEYLVKRTPHALYLNDRMRVGQSLDMHRPNLFLSVKMTQPEFEEALASINNLVAMNLIRERHGVAIHTNKMQNSSTFKDCCCNLF